MTASKETRRAERRGQPERFPREMARARTQSRAALPPNLTRVNAAARRAAHTRFTALLHHVDEVALERAFGRQRRRASAGVDGMTVAAYEQDQESTISGACAGASTSVVTGHSRPGGCTSRHPMAVGARWTCPPGGQDRPGRRCGGAELRLRGRLPGVLLRVPAGPKPTSCSRYPAHGPHGSARELGARCGFP